MPLTTLGIRTHFPAIDPMPLFRRIVFVSLLAGLIAGILITVLHQYGTVPIILTAETYEEAAEDHRSPVAQSEAGHHHHGADSWRPSDGLERAGYTALADILTGIGFALLLVCGYVLSGRDVDWRRGILWGLAGFATFAVAPGLGLRPELPGTEAAPLLHRQVWWLCTIASTGIGLGFLAFGRGMALRLAAIALLVLPHVYGAPQPTQDQGTAPEVLAHRFVVIAFTTSLLFWVVLGALTGFFYKKIRYA